MVETASLKSIRLNPEDVLFLNRQIASLARLNMPIAKGLRILARDVKNEDFKRVIEAIQQDLDEGQSLEDALGKFPQTFSRLHLEIVKAGEATGSLAVILEELNAHAEAMKRVRNRIFEAVAYPLVISSIMFVFLLGFLYFIAPGFEKILTQRFHQRMAVEADVEGDADAVALEERSHLPPLTRTFFKLSHLVQNEFVLVLMLIAGATTGFAAYRKFGRMGEEYDDLLFRLPLFGKLFEGAALMKITRTMRDLLQNGVSMVETLRLASSTVGKNRIEQKLTELRLAVEEGGSFSRNLAGGGVFPDTMVWKLQMAEEKGIIEDALGELSNEFEVSVDQETTTITKVLSPMLLVVMGGVVFLMFVACVVPLIGSP